MLDSLWEAVKAIGGLTVIGGAAGAVAMLLMTQWFQRKLESHKSSLRATTDHALEQAKADLKIIGFQSETRFGRMHERVMQALLDTYPLLLSIHINSNSYLAMIEYSGKTKDQKLDIAAESFDAFSQFHRKTRILFPKKLSSLIDDAVQSASKGVREFKLGLQRERIPKDGPFKEENDPWYKAMKATDDHINPKFEAVYNELQRLLGIEDFSPQEKMGAPPDVGLEQPQKASSSSPQKAEYQNTGGANGHRDNQFGNAS